MRVIEDRASSHGELVVTILAVEEFLLSFEFRCGHLTSRALNASRPAETAQEFAALIIGRKSSINVN